MKHSFISRKQKRLLQVKRIINFVKTDVSREEYFSRPVKIAPLYSIDFKRTGKIVRAPITRTK
jgi:hypothetical protein